MKKHDKTRRCSISVIYPKYDIVAEREMKSLRITNICCFISLPDPYLTYR